MNGTECGWEAADGWPEDSIKEGLRGGTAAAERRGWVALDRCSRDELEVRPVGWRLDR